MADLKASISKGLTTINVKTSNFMKQNEINTYISTLENEIKDLKFQIGDMMYSAKANGTNCDEDVAKLLDTIQEKYALIDEQNKEKQELAEKEKQILGNAGAAAPAQVKYCTKCGHPNEMAYKFCEKCGNPLQ